MQLHPPCKLSLVPSFGDSVLPAASFFSCSLSLLYVAHTFLVCWSMLPRSFPCLRSICIASDHRHCWVWGLSSEGCSPLGLTSPSSTSYSWQCRRRKDREASSAQCLSTGIQEKEHSRCSMHFAARREDEGGEGPGPRSLSGNSPSSGEASGRASVLRARLHEELPLVQFPSPGGLERRGGPVASWGSSGPPLPIFSHSSLLAWLLPVARGQFRVQHMLQRTQGFLGSWLHLEAATGQAGTLGAGKWQLAPAWFGEMGGLESLLAKADSQNFFSDSQWLWTPINIPNIQNTVHHFQGISRHLFKKKKMSHTKTGRCLLGSLRQSLETNFKFFHLLVSFTSVTKQPVN